MSKSKIKLKFNRLNSIIFAGFLSIVGVLIMQLLMLNRAYSFEKKEFEDKIQGGIKQNILKEFGDFILKRSDGIYAYQLAVVIDDALQNINTIIRGSDLIDSSSRQIYLQKILSLPKVAYGHVPVATLNQKKLSKENQSIPINISNVKDNLIACLKFLGQDYEVVRKENTLKNFWATAIQLWDISLVPKIKTIEI